MNAERDLAAKLVGVVDTIEKVVKAKLFPRLQQFVAEARRVRGDAWSDDMDRTLSDVRLSIDDELPDRGFTASVSASRVSDFNLSQWRHIVKAAVGIDLFTAEPWLRPELSSWARETANLIGSLEDDAVRQVSLWTDRGIREGWRWEDIAKNIEDRFDVSRNRARFIARDQIGSLNGQLTERRQHGAGVKKYFWRDSRDERVTGNPDGLYPKAKPSHWARNGESFDWNHPPEGGHPGRRPLCRCTAEPDLSGLLDTYNEENG